MRSNCENKNVWQPIVGRKNLGSKFIWMKIWGAKWGKIENKYFLKQIFLVGNFGEQVLEEQILVGRKFCLQNYFGGSSFWEVIWRAKMFGSKFLGGIFWGANSFGWKFGEQNGEQILLEANFIGRKFWGACFGGADFLGGGNFASKNFFEDFWRVKFHSGGRKEYWVAKINMRSKHFFEQIFIFNGFSIELNLC